ncbi:Tc toxin subunit A-related protein [Polyangium mundeleinium]|uniref:Neuraminidase-like domain-containing protein n=1 Tax=Polyangium mundeleinium TaxID=2995306 RepID=A0ABT5EL69_9BACT|nr:neuraminidase-like domain-containing protein [Polyangium mundeleinium]MDC0742546.1 neuraminidase-like domain-containing protein [Polyangium mundeleinium]
MNEELDLEDTTAKLYRLQGRIIDVTTGHGVGGVYVEAWDQEALCPDLVATAKTNADGHFAITLDDAYLGMLFADRRPALKFRLFESGLLTPPPTVTWQLAPGLQRIHIRIPAIPERTDAPPACLVVRGRITDTTGARVFLEADPDAEPDADPPIVVTAFHERLPDPGPRVFLGSCTTRDGMYRIIYRPDAFAPDAYPSLVVKATYESTSGSWEAESEVICRAPTTAIVDLVKGGAAFRGPPEVERVAGNVEAALGPVNILDIDEEDLDHSIARIACRTGEDKELVALWFKSARIADDMGLVVEDINSAGIVYLLLRQGIPQTRRGILSQRPATLRQAFEASFAQNVGKEPPEDAEVTLNDIMDALVDKMVEFASEPRVPGASSFADVVRVGIPEIEGEPNEELQEAFIRAVLQHEGTVEQFWSQLGLNTAFSSGTIADLKKTLQVGAFTRYHAPLVEALSGEVADARELAGYDTADWMELLEELPCPPDIPGADETEKRTNYINILELTTETAFPTAVIADRVIRNEEPEADIRVFFESNPTFEFGASRVSRYIEQTTGALAGVSDVAATTEQLKRMERIFRVTPHYREMKLLLDAGLHSAQGIHRMGKRRFVAKFGPSMRNERAEVIFNRASWIATAATALFAKFGGGFQGLKLFALPDLATAIKDGHPETADWASLFGVPDTCACEHCRSVYGPAAYLVDLLEFLDRQDSNQSYPASDEGKFSARDVLIGDLSVPSGLKGRRPDIVRLLLSCKNTNTTLPYIDLVNEILEVVVANEVEEPDFLWPSDITSGGTSQELLAEPEIIHPSARLAAYAELADAIHPFELPFHLWGEEARVYLEHLGMQRHELLEKFVAPSKDPPADIADQIARERLRMSKREWEIVTAQSSPTPPTTAACWGMTGSDWITRQDDGLKYVRVFLRKAGISFEELRELLATKYVNPIAPPAVKLNPEAGCDIYAKLLTGLDEEVLGRIHRFLRLRKRLGFSITELDWTVSAFGATDIDAELVRRVADLVALRKELDLPLPVLLSFWGDIGTYSTEWGTSLYETTFLTKSALAQSAAFADVPSGPVDSTVIAAHAAGICVALRINVLEFGLLAIPEIAQQQMGITSPLAVNAPLSLANLSRLHRIVALARGLRIGIQDLLVLLELSGLDALTVVVDPPQPPQPPAVPATTRAFVELVRKVQRSKLTIAELHYLVRYAAPPGTQAGLSDEALHELAGELGALATEVSNETMLESDPENTHLHARLVEVLDGVAPAEAPAVAEQIIQVLDAPSIASTAARNAERAFMQLHLEHVFGDETASTLDKLVGPANTQDEPGIAVKAQRFAHVLASVLNHLRRTRTETQVKHALASEMNFEPEKIDHLLTQTLASLAQSGARALFDFMPGMHAAFEYTPPTPATADDRKKAIRRLHKAALVVTRLGLGTSELLWLYPDGVASTWLDLNELHLEGDDEDTDRQERFAALIRLVDLASFRDSLPKGSEDMLALFQKAVEIGSIEAEPIQNEQVAPFYSELAERTGWARDGVEHLIHTGFVFKVHPLAESDFRDERAFLSLQRAFEILGRLSITSAQALLWASMDAPLPPASPNAADIVLDIKRVARAKHDDAAWSEVARPVRDTLRAKQRDALVGYLVAKRNLSGPNELFDELLIDVEMSPCQLTSRIKQAISSVQTFVQRALLGLEEHVTELGEEAAREWDWMKSYRIWEANRKVFLYPENWIEPELRDDKTPFFEALESRLLQGEVTAESAEAAYREYLGSLHEVSKLEVAAICHEREDGDEPVDIVHVIARTHAMPRKYYYRKRIDSSYWTPWEKVELDIQGDHLLATVWNRRLHLFWPTFEPYTTEDNKKRQRINLAWSQRQSTGFGPVSMTKGSPITMGDTADLGWLSLVAEREGGELRIDCMFSLHATLIQLPSLPGMPPVLPPPLTVYKTFGHFRLDPCVGALTAAKVDQAPYLTGWAPKYSVPANMGHLEADEFPGNDGRLTLPTPKNFLPSPWGLTTMVLLQTTPGRFSLLTDRASETVILGEKTRDAIFYTDGARTFFMDARYRATTTWGDIAEAFPNAPAPVGQQASGALDPIVLEWANEPKLDLGANGTIQGFYRFHTFYHPYVCDFIRRLERGGIDGLLRWDTPISTSIQLAENDTLEADYNPTLIVGAPFPIENVDFSFGGAYSQYNWEVFFHAPFLAATRLSTNGRFEEADRWFRYIFDPTGGAPGNGPERFWNVRPFRENIDLASIQAQLEQLAEENPNAKLLAELFGVSPDSSATQDMTAQLDRWRENPFNPHLIARMRPLAYQKSVVMKYVENLLSWGDSLFRRDTMESINEATQLYILASRILGDRPRLVKTQDVPPKSYAELEPDVDAFSNALVEIETLIQAPPEPNTRRPRREPPPVLRTLYFCVPPNDEMLALWDTVEDRLFKIRHCMNIEGTVRQLALFEPPIDPGLLVRAAAGGLDFGELLSVVNAPIPVYRFSVLQPKAVEFAGSVISLGASLLAAIEKRDGEALSLLRQTQEIELLESVREVRKRQVDEAQESLEALRRSRAVIEERHRHYSELDHRIAEEREQRKLTTLATAATVSAQGTQLVASGLKLIPQIAVGLTAFTEFGGEQLAGVAEIGGQMAGMAAAQLGAEAAMAGIEASYKRRAEDWQLQIDLASRELAQIDRQILAAEVRLDIAQKEYANHELSVKNAKEIEDHLKTKYTSKELYGWMASQVESVYFQAYKLAYELAKRAERAFQFELAQPGASYITFGHWDSAKKGLLAGERLQLALRRMEAAYLEQNKREYEITKHVSLAEVDPQALLKLRETGQCEVELPEVLFDQDWPGHYLRRIKSVSMTVPVVNGPYAGVNCKLTLLKSSVRMKTTGGYARIDQPGQPDPRFLDHYGVVQSIVTSSGQSDSGLFELVFRDERYLPFEGSGADSTWRIELDGKTNRFDPTAVHDVVLHVRYTARDGGESLKNGALDALGALEPSDAGPTGFRLFSAKTDFPDAWHVFLTGEGEPATHSLSLPFALRHFLPLVGSRLLEIKRVQLFAKRSDGTDGSLTVALDAAGDALTGISLIAGEYGKLLVASIDDVEPEPPPESEEPKTYLDAPVPILAETSTGFAPWTLTVSDATPSELEDVWIVCEYSRVAQEEE